MRRNTLTRGLAATLAGLALVLTTAGACGPSGEQAPPTQQQQGGDQGGDQDDDNDNGDDNDGDQDDDN